jgi:hypothetical protein
MPSFLVVTKLSKTWPRISGGMPGPESATVSAHMAVILVRHSDADFPDRKIRIGEGLHRVEQEVEEDLFELHLFAGDGREIVF